MREVHSGDRGCRIQPGHVTTRDWRLGVTLAREHDAHRVVRAELWPGTTSKVAGCGSKQKFRKRRHQPRQYGLSLGVTESSVELDDANPVSCDDESAIKEAHKRGSLGLEHANDRLAHGVNHFANECLFAAEPLGQPRHWRVRTHAPGIWAFVVVEDALEVLSR